MTTAVVLSPHLDDAIMSLGGTMHLLSRIGVSLRIVTLFAGDPKHDGAPSFWDAARRVRTAGESFAARRAEDDAAAAALGVETCWLPFLDASYIARRDPDEVWNRVLPHLRGAAAVFIPGSPLAHPDHEYTAMLAYQRLDPDLDVLFYAEQPYATRPRYVRSYVQRSTPGPLRHLGADLVWKAVHLDARARAAKARAVDCYAGEIARLGPKVHLDRLVARVLRSERIAHRAGDRPPAVLGGVL
jgi:LmbE family N-acetylglucosaminyl deacetylase